MPELALNCIESWKKYLPDYELRLWNEETFDLDMFPYTREAYDNRKFAFVTDVVRLWALEKFGGVYMDTDVEILRSYDALIVETIEGQPNRAFIGFEESLAHLPGTCVMGCEAHCGWVKDMLAAYKNASFRKSDGSLDMRTNVDRLGEVMKSGGLIANGKRQYIEKWGLTVYDHHYFSPLTSTRVMRMNKDTYSIHRFAGSWTGNKNGGIKDWTITREIINALIQLKRFILGIK